jgi:hypothetical protein
VLTATQVHLTVQHSAPLYLLNDAQRADRAKFDCAVHSWPPVTLVVDTGAFRQFSV